jgi:hypothetical protein
MGSVVSFLAGNILSFYSGSAAVKLKSLSLLVLSVSPVAYMFEKVNVWTMLNRDFIFGVLVAIAIDHFIGSIYHGFKAKDFTFKKNLYGLMVKISLCIACGVLFEILSGMTSYHKWLFEYLQLVTRLIVFLYPAGSAFVNMSKLTNGVFPPIGWMDRLKKFNQNLNIDDLKNKKDEESK